MADLAQAVDQVRSIQRVFQAVIDLADAAGDAASLQQAANEAANQLAATRAQIGQANAELDAAQAKAGDILTGAQSTADAIVTDAGEKASRMLLVAQSQADDLTAKAIDKLADLNAQIATANETLAGVGNDLEARKAELADAQAKLDRIRAKIAELAGG